MDSVKKKTLIIAGSTAVGKTKLGLSLAQKYGGEIVSADSRQVYKYLDIGTGKDIDEAKFTDQTEELVKKENLAATTDYVLGYYLEEGVPIWMLDLVEPSRRFNVAEFVSLAKVVLAEIRSRQKLPIIVGGSGFYLGGLVDGYETMGVPPDLDLRSRLERLSLSQLQNHLHKADPKKWKRLNSSDRQNPRRLIRAIEVAEAKKTQKPGRLEPVELGDVLFVFLTAPREQIYSLIDQRVEERLAQGMVDEIKRVLDLGFSWDDPGLNTLGYKQLRAYFEKEQTLEEAVFHWKAAEHQYARQQLQWFKRDPRYQPFDVTNPKFTEDVNQVVGKWLD